MGDDELVDALLEASAVAGIPLDEHCVADVVAKSDIANLDDELVRLPLLEALRAAAEEPPTETIVSGSTVVAGEPGWLAMFDTAPFPIDMDDLRGHLLRCVAGSADPELVEQAAVLVTVSGVDQALDSDCVTRLLTTFSDETLQLLVDDSISTTRPPAELEEPGEVRSELYRVEVCVDWQEPAATTESVAKIAER